MNMGYIRFENTLKDLEDCEQRLLESGLNQLSDSERRKAVELIGLYESIWMNFGDLIEE